MIKKPKYKIGRRLGAGVSDKCQTQKFAISEARHAKATKFKKHNNLSEFGGQLIEKQKIRYTYGISEKQLSNYIKDAINQKTVVPVDKFIEGLESRLDNVVYRIGFATTRSFARQTVSHGHFLVNDKKINIPSFQVKVGDIVAIRKGSEKKKIFSNLDKKFKDYHFPNWIQFNLGKMEAKITRKPQNDDAFLSFSSVLEFYSR